MEAVQKRAIHITHNLTRGMPYSSMLLHVDLDSHSLAVHREDLSRRFSVILWILPPVFTASFLHQDPLLSPLRSDVLKSFLKSILVPSAIVLLCNIVLTTTSNHTFLPSWSLFDYLSFSCLIWSHDYVYRPIRSFCSWHCLSCFCVFSCFYVGLLILCGCVLSVTFYWSIHLYSCQSV